MYIVFCLFGAEISQDTFLVIRVMSKVNVVHAHHVLNNLLVDVLDWILLHQVFQQLDGFANFVQEDLACRQVVGGYDVRWSERLHLSEDQDGVFIFLFEHFQAALVHAVSDYQVLAVLGAGYTISSFLRRV